MHLAPSSRQSRRCGASSTTRTRGSVGQTRSSGWVRTRQRRRPTTTSSRSAPTESSASWLGTLNFSLHIQPEIASPAGSQLNTRPSASAQYATLLIRGEQKHDTRVAWTAIRKGMASRSTTILRSEERSTRFIQSAALNAPPFPAQPSFAQAISACTPERRLQE